MAFANYNSPTMLPPLSQLKASDGKQGWLEYSGTCYRVELQATTLRLANLLEKGDVILIDVAGASASIVESTTVRIVDAVGVVHDLKVRTLASAMPFA